MNGLVPAQSLGARNVVVENRLPPLHNDPRDPIYQSVAKAQVLVRAEKLGLTPESAVDAWQQAGAIDERGEAAANRSPTNPTVFSGARASELNRLMARPGRCAVRVTSPTLRLDQPLYPGSHCMLDLGPTRLISVGFQPYQVQIKGRNDVWLRGGRLRGGLWGVSIAHSSNVAVLDMQMEKMGGGGVMVTNSHEVTLQRNRFSGLGGAAVMLHGDTVHAVVADNEMAGNTGWSNWHAGIVVSDRNADPGDDATTLLRDDGFLVKQTKIIDRLTIPHDNVIVRNQIRGNKTSGIYSDGGARNTFVQNTIENNSKEGMCLDNGSTSNVVAFNLFRANGNRWGMTDAELQRDFVWKYGRLADGTSAAKLPGISMDNAAYNQVVYNEVERNFGSGIKMVRTSLFNRVGLNTLVDHNQDANEQLPYSGILLGFAKADEAAWDLDFLPSRGNQVFANNIRGSNFAGIFFEEGADYNAVFANSIFGDMKWALNSARPQAEESFNNPSNLPSWNMELGLGADLVRLGVRRRE